MVQVTVSTSSASVDSVSTRIAPPCFTIRPARWADRPSKMSHTRPQYSLKPLEPPTLCCAASWFKQWDLIWKLDIQALQIWPIPNTVISGVFILHPDLNPKKLIQKIDMIYWYLYRICLASKRWTSPLNPRNSTHIYATRLSLSTCKVVFLTLAKTKHTGSPGFTRTCLHRASNLGSASKFLRLERRPCITPSCENNTTGNWCQISHEKQIGHILIILVCQEGLPPGTKNNPHNNWVVESPI